MEGAGRSLIVNDGAPSLRTTTGELAAKLGAELLGPADLVLDRVDGLEHAGPTSLSFIRSSTFAASWPGSRAGAALVTRGIEVPGHDASARALLLVPDADEAMVQLLRHVAPRPAPATPGVHASAVVHPTARVAPGASVGPHCSIDADAVIGDGAVLVSGVRVGRGAAVGPGAVLHPGVALLDRCRVGPRSILHAGVVIGADGFGYVAAADGSGPVKVPHLGHVEIGADVEIGANTCVDRGKFGPTTIGDGTKIDNLVQIGHNCRVGRGVVICGQSALSGSVTIGDGAVIGGGVGIADGCTIGARAHIGGRSGVMNDIPEGERWMGYPAVPGREFFRTYSTLRELAQTLRAMRRQGADLIASLAALGDRTAGLEERGATLRAEFDADRRGREGS